MKAQLVMPNVYHLRIGGLQRSAWWRPSHAIWWRCVELWHGSV